MACCHHAFLSSILWKTPGASPTSGRWWGYTDKAKIFECLEICVSSIQLRWGGEEGEEIEWSKEESCKDGTEKGRCQWDSSEVGSTLISLTALDYQHQKIFSFGFEIFKQNELQYWIWNAKLMDKINEYLYIHFPLVWFKWMFVEEKSLKDQVLTDYINIICWDNYIRYHLVAIILVLSSIGAVCIQCF